MKPRTAEAARLEADYLARVKAAIAGREASEIDEIIGSLREHIEEELSDTDDDRVSLVQMANVLEELGPPESYGEEDGAVSRAKKDLPSGTMSERSPRLSKLAVAAALCLPIALLIGGIFAALAHGSDGKWNGPVQTTGAVCFCTILLLGAVLGIAALISIRSKPNELRGKALAWIGILAPAIILLFLGTPSA
jgi:hypothetical protein